MPVGAAGLPCGSRASLLQCPDCVQVGRAVAGPPAHDRAHVRRELDHPGAAGCVPLPSWRGEQEGPGLRAGSPPAYVSEVVGPRIDELQHVIPSGGVWYPQQHRAAAHIDLREGVDRVVVDRDEPVIGPGQPRRVAEGVNRAWCDHSQLCLATHHLQVEDQREAVDVGVCGQCRQLITHFESSLSVPQAAVSSYQNPRQGRPSHGQRPGHRAPLI